MRKADCVHIDAALALDDLAKAPERSLARRNIDIGQVNPRDKPPRGSCCRDGFIFDWFRILSLSECLL